MNIKNVAIVIINLVYENLMGKLVAVLMSSSQVNFKNCLFGTFHPLVCAMYMGIYIC